MNKGKVRLAAAALAILILTLWAGMATLGGQGDQDQGTRIQQKMERVQSLIQQRLQQGANPMPVAQLLQGLDALLQDRKLDEAEALLDHAIDLANKLEVPPDTRPPAPQTQVQFGARGWLRAGADAQLTGWQRAETEFSKDNARNVKLLWKLKLSSDPVETVVPTEAIFDVRFHTEKGFKDIAIVIGSSNTIYAVDYELGRLIWQKHFDVQGGAAQGPACQNARTAAAFIQPQGYFLLDPPGPSAAGAASPAQASPPSPSGPNIPDAARRVGRGAKGVTSAFRGLYVLTSDGFLHEQLIANGEDYAPAVKFLPSANGNLSNLTIIANTVYVSTSRGCGGVPNGIWDMDMSTPEYKLSSYTTNGVSVSGLDGSAQSTNGKILYVTTGGGSAEPSSGVHPNSVIAVDSKTMTAQDYYTPAGATATAKSNIDVSPLVFAYKGHDLIAAYVAGGRLALLDSASLGGADHSTPLFMTDPISKNGGSGAWGRLASFVNTDGTRWIFLSVQGPLASGTKFPTTNGGAPNGSIVAFKVADQNGKTVLTPGWVSPDMTNPSPVAIANGLVFALANGETKKSHAKLYVVDAGTGVPMYSSGDEIASSANFASVSVSGGDVLFVTSDGTLYSFGIGIEH